jgi:AbrB family looped-hinge helix DNA binding protein
MLMTARMSRNGQVVIPHQVRVRLGLQEGAIFRVSQTPEGVLFQPLALGQTRQEGSVPQKSKPVNETSAQPDLSYEDIKNALERSLR